jgi:hypothetical protein
MTQPRRSSLARLGDWLFLAGLLLGSQSGCTILKGNSGTGDQSATAAVPSTPGKNGGVRISQYVFYSDFTLKPTAPLFVELSELREQIYKELQLPPSNTVVQVFLFEDKAKYERYMKAWYPNLPDRRAFFIAQPRSRGGADDLYVYTFWGEHIRQDLRHELTHALLHSVLKDVPLWLDEGLAEFFELPPERNGLNQQHVVQLRQSLDFDMARLEQLSEVKQMGRPEYREAWAWVHLMLRGKPEAKAVLLNYIKQLRGSQQPGSLLVKLREVFPSPGDSLVEHLNELDPTKANRSVAADRR